MTTFNLTCEAVETLLHEYVDGTLDLWLRESVEQHLNSCARCTKFARDLRNLTREASALPGLLPEGDVWSRVADRIGASIAEPEPVAERVAETTEPVSELVTEMPEPVSELVVQTPEPVTDIAAETPEPVSKVASQAPNSEWVKAAATAPQSERVPIADDMPFRRSQPRVAERERKVPPIEFDRTVREFSVPITEPVSLERVSQPSAALPLAAIPLADPPTRARESSWGPVRITLTAAALMLVTAATSSLLTVRWLGLSRTPSFASDTRPPSPGSKQRSNPNPNRANRGTAASAAAGQVAVDSSAPAPLIPSARLASALTDSSVARDPVGSPEDAVYNKEIKALKRIVRRQNADLEHSTAVEIEQNLGTLDSAIAEIRAALRKDPGSQLLNSQTSRTLEMKVELLRRAAMLSSST